MQKYIICMVQHKKIFSKNLIWFFLLKLKVLLQSLNRIKEIKNTKK